MNLKLYMQKPMLNIWSRVTTLVLGILFWASNSNALMCKNIFHSQSENLIPMLEQYRGENQGKYIDTLTKKPWLVKYFSEAELKSFQLQIVNGLMIDAKGRRADSDYDSEALSFTTSLLVIDKNKRIFAMPFEKRGEYHHSSLSGGDDILFAGTVAFFNGKVIELSNSSGHYRPNTAQTLLILKWLDDQKLLDSNAKLHGRAAMELGKSPGIKIKDLFLRPK